MNQIYYYCSDCKNKFNIINPSKIDESNAYLISNFFISSMPNCPSCGSEEIGMGMSGKVHLDDSLDMRPKGAGAITTYKNLAFKVYDEYKSGDMYRISWKEHWDKLSNKLQHDLEHFEIIIGDHYPLSRAQRDTNTIITRPDPPIQHLYQSEEPPQAIKVRAVFVK